MDTITSENEQLDFSSHDSSALDPSHPRESPQRDSSSRDRSNGNSRHSTGPTSPTGKAKSSQNSITHGCRSKTVILPGESQQEFDDLYDRWMLACEPEDPAGTELVENLIREKWYLRRNIRRYEELEQELSHVTFLAWTPGEHHRFQLAMRYKTTAERAVSRAMREVEAWKKTCSQREKQLRSAEKEASGTLGKLSDLLSKTQLAMDQTAEKGRATGIDVSQSLAVMESTQKQLRASLDNVGKQLEAANPPPSRGKILFQGQNNPKKLRKIPILDQWIEITVEDGQTITKLYPSNEKLIEKGQTMDPPPEIVYRRMNFVNGIPPEYHWTADEDRWALGGMGIQRMTVDTWLDIIDLEKTDPSGHIGRCGGNLPRPKERGGCDCEVCSYNRNILEGVVNEETDQPLTG